MIQKKHIGLIIGIFLLIGIATTGYAQNERLMNIGEIELIPGTTIRPNDIKGDWTDEMYRQWFDELNRLMRESLRPNERPVITTPDFEKMTQDEIDAWRDSVINILYPNATIQRADKQTENREETNEPE